MNIGEATSDKDLLRAVEELRVKRLNQRRPFETIWWNNIAFYSGDHYSTWDATRQTYVTEKPKDGEHQVRLVINQARVIVRQEISKVTKARPIMDVVPRSNDEEDIAATKVGTYVLSCAEWKHKLRRVRRNAWRWAAICGVGGVYVGYDAANDTEGLIELVIDPNTNEPVWHPERREALEAAAEKGEIELVKEQYPLGDLEFKMYSPFQLLPDDTAADWTELKDLITTDVVEIEKAKDMWPEAAGRIRPEGRGEGGILTKLLSRAGLAQSLPQASEDTVNVHTYWLLPGIYDGQYLESGKMVRWCNSDVELENFEVFPFNDRRMPVAFFTHTPNPLTLWPDTTLQDIAPINLELDKTISLLLENRDYMVSPMWLEAEQLQIRPWIRAPGNKIKYTAVRDVPPPQQVEGAPLPAQTENLVVGLRDMILDVSGSGEVSRGRVPSGVRAGNMLAFLQEQDETQIAPITEEFEDSVAYMASLTLSRYAEFYTVPRLMRDYRPGGLADVRKFKGADLKGNTDVVVQAGSALPQLKAAKQQYVLQLAEMGIERDPKRIKDMLELGEGEPDDIDLAMAQADRENDLMIRAVEGGLMEGEEGLVQQQLDQSSLVTTSPDAGGGYGGGPPGGNGDFMGISGAPEFAAMDESQQQPTSFAVPVKTWHIHEAHIQRHRRKMMQPDFERLAMTRPDIVRIFDEHVAMHEQAIQQQQMQQMQMMLAAQGGPSAAVPPEQAQPQAESAAALQASGGV